MRDEACSYLPTYIQNPTTNIQPTQSSDWSSNRSYNIAVVLAADYTGAPERQKLKTVVITDYWRIIMSR